MGLIDKFKDLIGSDEDDFYDDEEMDFLPAKKEEPAPLPSEEK